MLKTVQDIENVTVSTKNGLPIRVADVATVSIGHDLRTGAATYNGEETVLGIAMMMMGENSKSIAQALTAKCRKSNVHYLKGWWSKRYITAVTWLIKPLKRWRKT
jgi:cobalt-zinc-cadmium resistance protein CzcA